ncbi:MAG: DMT family protein [Planctomycetaceae bacterium]
MRTVLLLTASNIFMTFAWYGHLKYKNSALWVAILVSWGIAFFEYCLQVPANRWGHGQFSAAQLKIMQEVITLVVFGVFSALFLNEKLRWNEIAGFVLILAAVTVVFGFKETKAEEPHAEHSTVATSPHSPDAGESK